MKKPFSIPIILIIIISIFTIFSIIKINIFGTSLSYLKAVASTTNNLSCTLKTDMSSPLNIYIDKIIGGTGKYQCSFPEEELSGLPIYSSSSCSSPHPSNCPLGVNCTITASVWDTGAVSKSLTYCSLTFKGNGPAVNTQCTTGFGINGVGQCSGNNSGNLTATSSNPTDNSANVVGRDGSDGSSGQWSGGGFKVSDLMSYLSFSPYQLQYIKTIAQAYGDISNANPFAIDGDLSWRRGIYPDQIKIANYGNKRILFLGAGGYILVYDVTDSSNPIKLSDFLTSDLSILKDGLASGYPSVRNIYVSDDFNYLILDIRMSAYSGSTEIAVLNFDSSTGKLTLKSEQFDFENYNSNSSPSFWKIYKGGDGNNYFIASPEIYSIDKNGKLQKVNSLHFSDYYIYAVTNNNGTYLLSGLDTSLSPTSDKKIKGYDISNPISIKKLDDVSLSLFRDYYPMSFDSQSNRLYFWSSENNELAVVDLSNFPKVSNPVKFKINRDILRLMDSWINPLSQYIHASSSDFIVPNVPPQQGFKSIDVNWEPYNLNSSNFIVSNNVMSIAGLPISLKASTSDFGDAKSEIESKFGKYINQLLKPQFIVSFADINHPKLIGVITGRRSSYDTGTTAEDEWYRDISYIGGYLYRADIRRADVWKLGNPPAQSARGASGGTGLSNSSISTTTIQNLQQTLFSFQNLLNIFKRIYAK
jgi:hypothetical protein